MRSSLGKVKGGAALTEASISIPTSRPHGCFFLIPLPVLSIAGSRFMPRGV